MWKFARIFVLNLVVKKGVEIWKNKHLFLCGLCEKMSVEKRALKFFANGKMRGQKFLCVLNLGFENFAWLKMGGENFKRR